MAFIINDVYSDADASVRNKCRNGKRYKAKAKVNGPNGCIRTVVRDNNCSGVDTDLLRLFKSPDDCTCLGPDANIYNPVGAAARAISKPGEVSEYAFKFGGCRKYRAGGYTTPVDDSEFQNTDTGVESFASFRDYKVDYEHGYLTLSDFKAKLKIQSRDFENEFALFQILVNEIKHDSLGNEIYKEIVRTEVYIQNGKLYIYGKNIFRNLDFEKHSSEYYYEAIFNNSDLQIDLSNPIDTSMNIEVSLRGDVGNILAGESDLREFDYKVLPSFNVVNNVYQIQIDSEFDQILNLTVKDLNSTNTLVINHIYIVGGERKLIVLDENFIKNSSSQILLLQTESRDGQIMNNVILKSQ